MVQVDAPWALNDAPSRDNASLQCECLVSSPPKAIAGYIARATAPIKSEIQWIGRIGQNLYSKFSNDKRAMAATMWHDATWC